MHETEESAMAESLESVKKSGLASDTATEVATLVKFAATLVPNNRRPEKGVPTPEK